MRTDASIHRIAGAILREAGVSGPPVDVEFLAARLGARVLAEESTSDVSGALYRLDSGPVIGVNAAHGKPRRRFTIAHELGHLVLHEDTVFVDRSYAAPPVRSRPSYLRDRRSSQAVDPVEIEANKFAASLLMPAGFIREGLAGRIVPVGEVDLGELAELFGVSRQAMGFRLVNLGIPVDQT